ncbi:plant intracellular Ras-group-related LRR protein 4-like [Hordeum vulgare subsp. vulgare]|uniref:plant intracellular Ras-group-related LRR protein 4-like n=1 Tax=Hordeum vulgare subsp. vulgare TaxID=112509 RepID=UPI001D1A474D|nr:plant intracellular Ras-group-related LRR protein 4-like [Hordeum vulgare subsp. vulgare]
MEATTAFGTLDGVVGEITRLHRSQMVRLTLEDVEAAEALAYAANREERARLDVAEALRRSPLVPEELVYVAQEMHRTLAGFQCLEQRDATRILELDALHALFDDLIQRASQCVPSTSTGAEPRITSTAAAGAASSSSASSARVLPATGRSPTSLVRRGLWAGARGVSP